MDLDLEAGTDMDEATTNILLVKGTGQLQILVFHSVRNSTFYWTSGMATTAVDYTFQAGNAFEIPLGIHQTIFDEFSIQVLSLEFIGNKNNIKRVLVPENVPHFVQQLPYYAYVPCNRAVLEVYKKAHYAKYPIENRTWTDRRTRFTIGEMKGMLKSLLIPFWVCFGTLLGRQYEYALIRRFPFFISN